MTPAGPSLRRRYGKVLRAHVSSPGEETRAAAGDLGRAALEAGISLPDLCAMHAELAEGPGNGVAAEFLEEVMAPYEMALRGFREANESLRDVNADLQQRNEQLARARIAAEAASNELEAFSYSVSHDLRAPLRAIDGFSRALVEDSGERLDERGMEHVRRVRAGVDRMAKLIDDLLRLSRVAANELVLEDVDMTALAGVVAERLAASHPDRNVRFDVQPGLVARADARLVEIVFENLLGNAWKFTARRPVAHVEVGVRPDRRGDAFFVRDDGAGFDPAFATRMFAPFARFHSAREFEGTGIGLATVARIVRRHGGRIWADSEPEKGATFFFTLDHASTATSTVTPGNAPAA